MHDGMTWKESDLRRAIAVLGGKELPGSAAHALFEPSGGSSRLQEICEAARLLNVQLTPVSIDASDLSTLGRAIVCVPTRPGGAPRYLVICGAVGHRIPILRPDGGIERIRKGAVARFLKHASLLASPIPSTLLERMGADVGEAVSIAASAGQSVLPTSFHGMVMQPASGVGFFETLRAHRLWQPLVVTIVAVLGLQVATLLAWWFLGRWSLHGELDQGSLVVWAGLWMSAVPLQVLRMSAEYKFENRAVRVLNRRLLRGAIRLDANEAKTEGFGSLLARVSRARVFQAVTKMSLFQAVSGVATALSAGYVLWASDRGGFLPWVVAIFIVLYAAGAWHFARRRFVSNQEGLRLALESIENVLGYRTRLVQLDPQSFHDDEDAALANYYGSRVRADRTLVVLRAVGGLFLVAALLALMPVAAAGRLSETGTAVVIGGLLLIRQAFTILDFAAVNLALAVDAGRWVWPLIKADSPDNLGSEAPSSAVHEVLLSASAMSFRYPGQERSVLSDCDFELRRGDKVLLEGASGSGKSTLVGLMSGLRAPTSGDLDLCGLSSDLCHPERWRRTVAMSPQFHDNAILDGTLAYNLLMARHWPPSSVELLEADAVCRDLGLGDLLDRMPNGIHQWVGEGGWQLSHGERSRVFVARSLLQKPQVAILDESFSALDSHTAHVAFGAVCRHVDTLVLVAHP